MTVTNAEDIKDMRYAPGMHTTTTEIRNAEGEYATSSGIKRTKDSKVLKPADLNGEYAIITGLKAGTYTFCVQFDDESYNYYTVTVQ